MSDAIEAWRAKGTALTARLRPDLSDADWRGAMTVLAGIATITRRPAAAQVALAARGAGRDAMAGLAVRRAARDQLAAAFAAPPASRAVHAA